MKKSVVVAAKAPALAAQPEVVEMLEGLLDSAKKGEIVGLVAVSKKAAGDVVPYWDFTGNHRLELLGGMQILSVQLTNDVLGVDSEL